MNAVAAVTTAMRRCMRHAGPVRVTTWRRAHDTLIIVTAAAARTQPTAMG